MLLAVIVALVASANGLLLPTGAPVRAVHARPAMARTAAAPEMNLLSQLTDLLFPNSKRCAAAAPTSSSARRLRATAAVTHTSSHYPTSTRRGPARRRRNADACVICSCAGTGGRGD